MEGSELHCKRSELHPPSFFFSPNYWLMSVRFLFLSLATTESELIWGLSFLYSLRLTSGSILETKTYLLTENLGL